MFPIEDRGWIIIDQELWRELGEPWGVHLYDEAVRRVPEAFLAEPRYGVRRRPGVVHVPAGAYKRTERRIRNLFLSSLEYVLWLERRCWGDIRSLHEACAEVEASARARQVVPEQVARLFDLLVRCKAFMGFNWLVPKDEIASRIGELTGRGEEWGQEALLTLFVPNVVPHFTRLHDGLYRLAEQLAQGAEPDYGAYVEELGFAEGYPLRPQPLEQPEHVAAEAERICQEYGRDPVRIRSEREAALLRVKSNRQRRDRLCVDLLATVPPRQASARMQVLGITRLCALAADEEEERHLAEMRAVRAFRMVGNLVGIELAQVDEAELLGALGLAERCLPDLTTLKTERIYS